MSKRVAFYTRVSTDGQTTENQLQELEAVAEHRGWEVVTVFDDNGVSGSKGREHRKQFDALIRDATRGKFDMVAAWSVDRLGRSLQDLVAFLNELHGVGCDLYLHQQCIDTTTPAGKMMFQMCGVFAEFELAMIKERVNAGLVRAKKHGTKSGKAIGRPAISKKSRQAVIDGKSAGLSLRKIANATGVSVGTVHNILKAA